MENNYYVYQHVRLDTQEVFYVGKGKGKRAYSTWGRNKHWCHIVNKAGRYVEIIQSQLTERESLDLEIKTIANYREIGYALCNMTNGGEGTSGYIPNAETRVKMSIAADKKAVVNNFGEFYESASEASRVTGFSCANISRCCLGTRKSTGNYNGEKVVWVLEEDKDTLAQRVIEANDNKPLGPRGKKVINNFNEAYDGVRAVARATGLDRASISACCRGEVNYAGIRGYAKIIWVFKVDEGTLSQRVIEASYAHGKKAVSNNFGEFYESASEASRVTGVHHANISECCNGNRKSAGRRDGIKIIWSLI